MALPSPAQVRAAGRADRRRAAALRRQSQKMRPAGRCEGNFWRRFEKTMTGKILDVARKFELGTKTMGCRNGALGYVGERVLRALLRLVNYQTGRLEPSIDYLRGMTGLSRASVVEGLARLREAGFVEWIRRFKETTAGDQGAKGWQTCQTTNAYRVIMPAQLAHLVPADTAPAADEAEDDRQARKAKMIREFETAPAVLDAISRLGATIHAAG